MSRFSPIFILFFIPLIYACSASTNKPLAKKGVLDLRHWNFPDKEVVSLEGEWMFYWQSLLQPELFAHGKVPVAGQSEFVPSYWTSYTNEEGKQYPSTGFATYHLRILLPQGFKDTLGFSLPVFDTAFDFYLNGSREGGNGKVGKSGESSIPGYEPFLVFFKPLSDTLDMVLHVSNFHHRRGGFWKPIVVGKSAVTKKRSNVNALLVHVSLGFLIAYFLFFFFFYLLYPQNKTLIYFALTLGGVILRISATNIFPFHMLWHPSWTWLIRVEYGGTFIAFYFGIWYLYSLFPSRLMRTLTVANSIISGAILLIILFTKVRLFAWSMLYLQPLVLVFLIAFLVISFKKMKQGRKGDLLYFVAILLVLLALLNDIFLSNSWPVFTGEYILPFSILFFIFVQAIMIIRNWIMVYKEKEQLLIKNEYINANLENLVAERTKEIEQRNGEIKAQSGKITLQNDELQREIAFKNRFFSILAHDLRDPLSSILMYFQMATTNNEFSKRKDILASTMGIARSASSLVENLLYWGRSQGKQLSLNPQECDIEDIVKEIFTLLGEIAGHKEIDLLVSVSGDKKLVVCDREIMFIILRNLISNAIKFSHRGKRVKITIGYGDDHIDLEVEDKGVGMSDEMVKSVFSDAEMVSTYGTGNERGTGLGLKLCRDLIKLQQGDLKIVSKVGQGTKVTAKLPLMLRSEKS